jgi:hypothetical protein
MIGFIEADGARLSKFSVLSDFHGACERPDACTVKAPSPRSSATAPEPVSLDVQVRRRDRADGHISELTSGRLPLGGRGAGFHATARQI